MTRLKTRTIEISVWVMVLVGVFVICLSSVSASTTIRDFNMDCYQDFANQSTSCGGLATATNAYTGTGIGMGNLSFDGDWTTVTPAAFGTITINYTKPLNATGATWVTKDAMGFNTFFISSSSSCWRRDPQILTVRMTALGAGTSYYCIGLTGAQVQLKVGTPGGDSSTYEEAMSWIMNDSTAKTSENMTFNSSQEIYVRYLNIPQSYISTNATFNVSSNQYYYNIVPPTIIDDFDDGVINSSIWNWTYGGTYPGNIVVTEQFGYLYLYGIATLPFGEARINFSSNSTYDIFDMFGKNITWAGLNITFTGGSPTATYYNNVTIYLTNGTKMVSLVSYGSATGLDRYENKTGTMYKNASGVSYWIDGSYVGIADIQGNISWNINVFATQDSDAISVTLNNITYSSSNTSSPINPNISLGNTKIWNYNGVFNQQNNKTNNFALTLNSYLSSCTIVNGNCSVPIVFYSDTNITNFMGYSAIYVSNGDSLPLTPKDTGTTFETAMATFNLSVIFDTNVYPLASGKLYYCDISPCRQYQATRTFVSNGSFFNATIALPPINVSRNVSYYFNYTLSDGSTELNDQSSQVNLSVIFYQVNLSRQTCTEYNNLTVMNFTVYDEQNPLIRIDPIFFKGTFNFWLGDGSAYKTISFQNESTSSVSLCITNYTKSVWMDADIQYSDVNSTLYNPRNYYFDNMSAKANLNSSGQPIPIPINMYLLNKSIASSFIENVFDNNNLPFVGGLIYSNRWYPGEGIYRTVEISRTDTSGSTVGQFETETPEYQFNITRDTVLYLSTINQKIVPTAVPYTIQFFLGQNLQSPWGVFLNKTGFSYSGPTFNNNTKVVTFSYTDTSGVTQYVRMVVSLINGTGNNLVICDVNSTLSMGILNCDTSAYNGTVQASIYLSRSPETAIITMIFVLQQAISDVMGRIGYFMGWLIILTGFLVAIYNPTAGIVTGNVTMWFVYFTGLISFGWIWLVAIGALSIFIAVELNT